LVHGIESWKYGDSLKFLSLTRLDKRRIRSDLVETFKILNGFYNIAFYICVTHPQHDKYSSAAECYPPNHQLNTNSRTCTANV